MVHQNFLNLIEGSPGVVYSHFRVESSSDNKESSQNINLTSSTNKKYPQFLDGHYFWNAASKFSEIEWVLVYHLKEESLSDNKEFPQKYEDQKFVHYNQKFWMTFWDGISEFFRIWMRGPKGSYITTLNWEYPVNHFLQNVLLFSSYQALCVIFFCTNK